jgi:hypothetical protein
MLRTSESLRPPSDDVAERLAGNELHDEEIHSALAVEIVDRGDVRVVEFREGKRFLPEAPARILVTQAPGRQHLQRDVTIEPLVVRAIDDAHSAGTDAFEKPVVPECLAD